MKKYKYCAECGAELGDEFWMIRDNFLQVKYFSDPNGADNAFCCDTCLCESIMAEVVGNTTEEDTL